MIVYFTCFFCYLLLFDWVWATTVLMLFVVWFTWLCCFVLYDCVCLIWCFECWLVGCLGWYCATCLTTGTWCFWCYCLVGFVNSVASFCRLYFDLILTLVGIWLYTGSSGYWLVALGGVVWLFGLVLRCSFVYERIWLFWLLSVWVCCDCWGCYTRLILFLI